MPRFFDSVMEKTDDLTDELETYLRSQPNMFQPYENFGDFLNTLCTPIIGTVAAGLLIAGAMAAAVVSAAVCVVSLCVGLGAALVGAKESKNSSFELSASASLFSAACIATAIACTFAAIVASVVAPIKLVTRTAASGINAFVDLEAPKGYRAN